MNGQAEFAAEGPSVRLTIPAKPEYISLVRLALSGISRLRPLSDETLGDLKLAVTEACSNSVRHGYGEKGEGVVEVVYELQPDRLVVEVVDDGPGFDADGARSNEEDLAEGGLGIEIIKAVSDEFEAGRRGNGAGSRLRFVKFLDK
jgi:serine/threonine-protein kinase RsbW